MVLSKVVLPAPRNPDKRVTGTGSLTSPKNEPKNYVKSRIFHEKLLDLTFNCHFLKSFSLIWHEAVVTTEKEI